MKVLIAIAATALLTALVANNFPWWVCGVIAFIVAFALRLRAPSAFLAGLSGVALAWGLAAIWMDIQNAGVLSKRIGELFFGLPAFGILLITALLGGLVGGLGAWTGSSLASLLYGKDKTRLASVR